MFRDGYVIDLTSASYDSPDYVALKGQVRPRVKDKDPLTKRKYYQCWLVITSEGCIHSAYCTCKGGIDGSCRHVVATLFEVNDFLNDESKTTCTSKPCTWKRRACEADKLSQPIPAADLDTSVLSSSSCQTTRPNYCPLAEDVPKPDPDVFLKQLQTLCPNACLVKSVFKTTAALIAQPALTVTRNMAMP
ncbi:uncharacterized protein LOC132741496 [Ruditapes philippinarum]|uniref:uncharacterized protein LOC132741496 n=1 Tax=Ruditapes philippinarum TaxID=129788 RepID=UPI00295AF1AC|nr:uncharacterized protein LOC132741496 [Ruditapes philippinarum]